MKKSNIKYILSLVAAIMLAFACGDDFLEVDPAGALSESSLSTSLGVEGTLLGAYGALLGDRTLSDPFYGDASNWFWGSVLGGDANKGSDPGDQQQVNEIMLYNTQTTNASVRLKYGTAFEGVARSNAVLRLLAETEDVSDQERTTLEGQARFLRGHYYFDLKKNFNNVPFVDETWDGQTAVPNNQDLWPFIEMDFKFAYDNLPDVMDAPGKANKWAAGAYYGKTLLYQGKFAEAKAVFDEVIANGQTANGAAYALMPNFGDLFLAVNDNNQESIFAIQAAANTGDVNTANFSHVLNFPHGSSGPARPGGCCGFNQPSFDLVNSYRTTAEGLPLLDGSYNDEGNLVKSDFGLNSADAFTPDEGPLDPRLDYSVGRRGIPYLDWGPHPGADWIRNQSNGGPYSPRKFVYPKAGEGVDNDVSFWTPGLTAVNINIIRFADVLLMAAESEIELGNLDAALNYINQVRERASRSIVMNEDGSAPAANYNISLYSSLGSQAMAREAVRFERKLELAGEGQRFYDLVRWGIADEALNAYLANESKYLNSAFQGARFDDGKDGILPIPQDEIDLQGADVLQQNPGY